MILDISVAMLLTLTYNMTCVDRVIPEKLGILTSLPRTLLSGTMTGDSIMKTIPLTQGKFAIVDDEDYERINKHKWYALNCHGYWYAIRNVGKFPNRGHIYMHREILNVPSGFDTDHRNHCGLDNRKLNIRSCVKAQNNRNRKRQSGISKYKGVSWKKQNKKWVAQIGGSPRIHLGYYKNEIEAAQAYNKKAKELFGEFACTNF